MKKPFLYILILILFSACEIYNQENYREIIVVEAYMIAGRDLPELRVSRTLPADQEYKFEDAAISDADIQLFLLDDNGDPEEFFGYFSLPQMPGTYAPVLTGHNVLPRRTYRLEISFNNRPEIIFAETTIPDQIEVINGIEEQIVYQSEKQLEIVLGPTQKTQSQNIFVFDAISLEVSEENLTPFYRATVNNGDAEIEEFIKNSSGLINEGNFSINPDGTISLKYPWIGIAFFGDNLIVTNSVDKNLADLVRSQEVQFGGSTLSPGEIPNLQYNIEGGIGIFGSVASDTIQTRFIRP